MDQQQPADRTTQSAQGPDAEVAGQDELVGKLRAIATDLTKAESEIERRELWRRAQQVLAEVGADSSQVDRAVGRRSAMAFSRFVDEVETGGLSSIVGGPAGVDAVRARRTMTRTVAAKVSESTEPPTPDELKKAIRAFKKRLKLTRLNEESKLGRSPMTSGKKSAVVAITPPNGFRPAVWTALTEQGRLRATGRGFYELVGSEA